jgi:hypothetical protein
MGFRPFASSPSGITSQTTTEAFASVVFLYCQCACKPALDLIKSPCVAGLSFYSV